MDTVKKRRPAVTYGKSSARKRPLSDAFSSLSFDEMEEGSGSAYITPTKGNLGKTSATSASPADAQMSQFGKQSAGAGPEHAPVRNGSSRTAELLKRRPKLTEVRREQQSSQELGIFDVPSSGDDEPQLAQRHTRQPSASRISKSGRPVSKTGRLASTERLRVGKDKDVSSVSLSVGGSRLTSGRTLKREDSGSRATTGNKIEKLPLRPEIRTRRTTPSAAIEFSTTQTSASLQLPPSMKQSTKPSTKSPSQPNIVLPEKDVSMSVLRAEPLENVPRKRERLNRTQIGASKNEQPPIVRRDNSEGKKKATPSGTSKPIAEYTSRIKTPIRPTQSSQNLTTANPSSLLFETPDPNAKWFSETHQGDFTLTCDESIWDTILDDGPPQKKKSITWTTGVKIQRAESANSIMKEAISPPPPRRKLIHGLKNEESDLDEDSSGDEEMDDGSDVEPINSQTMSHAEFQSQMDILLGSQGNSQEKASSQSMNPITETGSETGGFVRRSGPNITYARQRSYLTEEVKEGGDPFADPLLLPARDFGSRYQSKQVEELEEEEQGSVKMMKSLHELREAGVNKRFLDTVEGHFEDIEGDVALGRKRAGYLELATKIRDKAFLQKFRANNFDRRLVQGLEKETDEIIQFVLSFVVWSFMHEDSTVQTVKNNGIIPMLIRMLDSERDVRVIAKDRKTNMSKAAQSLVTDFCKLLESSTMFAGRKPVSLSPRIVALQVLDLIIKKLRQSGWMEDYLPAACLKKLVAILNQFINHKDPQKIKLLDPLSLELPVSILESNSLGTGICMDTELSAAELGTLAKVLQSTMDLDFEGVKPLQLLIIRLGISLTTMKPAVCEVYASSSIIPLLIQITQAKFEALAGILEEEERLVELDMLILTLALMNNFAEWSDEARLEFLATHDSAQIPPVSVLLKLFVDRLDRIAEAESMEETQSNVGFGYLSILLGNLCQNSSVRKVIRLQMPKGSLEPLINAVHEFVAHNRKVDEERRAIMDLDDEQEGEGESYYRQHAERLEKVAVDLRGYGG